jgi:hypothetical protein
MDEARMIQTLLQPPIAFHRVFVTLTGSATSGLFLSQAWYWTIHNRDDREGWFYKSREDWLAETGLTRYEQETARNWNSSGDMRSAESSLLPGERKRLGSNSVQRSGDEL